MFELTLMGYVSKSGRDAPEDGPEVIRKKVHWPVVPSVGEEIDATDENEVDWLPVTNVIHKFHTNTIYIHFRADPQVLKEYVEEYGFEVVD